MLGKSSESREAETKIAFYGAYTLTQIEDAFELTEDISLIKPYISG